MQFLRALCYAHRAHFSIWCQGEPSGKADAINWVQGVPIKLNSKLANILEKISCPFWNSVVPDRHINYGLNPELAGTPCISFN